MRSSSPRLMLFRRRAHGFALVIALMLMVFLVMLMTTLTSLVRVDLQATGSGNSQHLARQNALLGLQIALAELQRTAGPDQRVTARADITPTAAVGNSHWTGVWKSTPPMDPPSGDDALKPVIPKNATNFSAENSLAPSTINTAPINWLVSGNEQRDGTFAHQPATSLTGGTDFGEDAANKNVYLVASGTLVGKDAPGGTPQPTEGLVIAPKVAIGEGSDQSGHYAWWVGDEGIKARIQYKESIPSAIGKDDAANTRLAFQLPMTSDPSVIDDLSDFFVRTNVNLKNLPNYDSLQMALISNGAAAADRLNLNKRWHDLSPFSRGLLTDTRWGGFRGDLTLAFENTPIFNKYFGSFGSNTDRFYFVSLSELNQYDAGFPNWSNLREYYNLKDATGISSGNTAASMATALDSGKKVQALNKPYTGGNGGAEGYHSNSPVHPLLARMQVTFGMRFAADGATPPNYTPVLLLKPLVALYNPYNALITAPLDDNGDPIDTVINWSLEPKITITVFNAGGAAKAGNPVTFYLREVLASSSIKPENLSMPLPADTDFKPGETRLFGLYSDVDRSTFETAESLPLKTEAANNYNIAQGFFVLSLADVLTASSTGETKDSGDPAFGLSVAEKTYLTLSDSDSFEIEVNASAPGTVSVSYGAAGGTDYAQYFGDIADSDTVTGSDPATVRNSGPLDVATVVAAGELNNIATWGLWLRGALDDLAQSRLLVDHNIRALTGPYNWDVMNSNFYASSIFTGEKEGDQKYGYIDDPISNIFNPNVENARFAGYWGGSTSSHADFGGVERVVLFDIPRSRPLSLGALQHANIGRYTIDPTYIIGNSFPPARLSNMNQLRGTGYSNANVDVWDLSYLLNQQLWDSYFFSGIPSGLTEAEITQLLARTKQLPNHRLRLADKTQKPEVSDLTNSDISKDTFYDVASRLVVDGAFNVNSTSEDAWAAFLASSRDLSVPQYSLEDGSEIGAGSPEDEVIFSRLHHPVGDKSTGSATTFWNGYRALSDDQIRDLANQIVTLIQQRGKPFATLAEFVNRPLENADSPNRPGILQQAIDLAELNDGIPGAELSGVPTPTGVGHNQINGTEQAVAFLGYLTQADILQALGPVISVRSDTFTIRSYGDVVNPITNAVEARAWCEAVVQRMPQEVIGNQDYMSRSANRKFRIISFRWLSQDEI